MAQDKQAQPAAAAAGGIAVVVVPLPAQGHLNQLLHLARLLAAAGLSVHYVGSAAHNRQVRDRAAPLVAPAAAAHHHHPITYQDIPISSFPCSPPDPHSPSGFPTHLQPAFDAAATHLRAPLESLLRSLSAAFRRVVVVHDSTMSFAAAAAAAADLPDADAFSFHSVSAVALLLYLLEARGATPGDKTLAGLTLPSVSNAGCFTEQFQDFVRRQHQMTAVDSGRLLNTCRAIEGRFLDLLGQEPSWRGQKTFAVGPLNPVTIDQTSGGSRHVCMQWLDEQPPTSVVYVSFGTTSTLPDEQILELAHGLEASGQRFIWVLRDADRADIYDGNGNGDDGREKLPLDYERRVAARGRVVRGWAPQLEILAHPATAGFVSHCGWNSCMESMSMGVPLLAWPMHSDQPRNTWLVTTVLGVGFTVRAWDQRHRVAGSTAIRDSIVRLMVSDEGKEVRERAGAVRCAVREAVMEGGTSKADLDAFIAHITR